VRKVAAARSAAAQQAAERVSKLRKVPIEKKKGEQQAKGKDQLR
jgi:hypothetical protein